MSLNPPLKTWDNRRVWIVGGSTGIGFALSQLLTLRGARVLVSARRTAHLPSDNPLLRALPCDVTDREAVIEVAKTVFEEGPVDLVVYAAAAYEPTGHTGWQYDLIEKHLDVNYRGALRVIDAVLPNFKARGAGHLSLISSIAGYRGLPQALSYGPTKAALSHLAEILYLDLHPKGIGVSAIHPGFVDTPLTKKNNFPMPFMMTPDLAAKRILAGWEAGRFDIHFPKRFTLLVKLLSLLPAGLYLPLIKRITRM